MEVRTNKQTNIQTDERKDENYIPLGINAGGIISSLSCQNINIYVPEETLSSMPAPVCLFPAICSRLKLQLQR